jgi:hypothetical protein
VRVPQTLEHQRGDHAGSDPSSDIAGTLRSGVIGDGTIVGPGVDSVGHADPYRQLERGVPELRVFPRRPGDARPLRHQPAPSRSTVGAEHGLGRRRYCDRRRDRSSHELEFEPGRFLCRFPASDVGAVRRTFVGR